MTYGRPADWSHTLDNLSKLMLYSNGGLTADDARDIFESIHGFRPDTGKPTPRRKRFVDHLVRFMAYWRLP